MTCHTNRKQLACLFIVEPYAPRDPGSFTSHVPIRARGAPQFAPALRSLSLCPKKLLAGMLRVYPALNPVNTFGTQLGFRYQSHESPLPPCLTLHPVSHALSATKRTLSIARVASLLLTALKHARRMTGRLTSYSVPRSPPSPLPKGRPSSITVRFCLIQTKISRSLCGFPARGLFMVTRIQKPRNSLVEIVRYEMRQSVSIHGFSDLCKTPSTSHTVMYSC